MTFQEAFDLMVSGKTVFRYGTNQIMVTCRVYGGTFIVNYHIPPLPGLKPGSICPEDVSSTNWEELKP